MQNHTLKIFFFRRAITKDRSFEEENIFSQKDHSQKGKVLNIKVSKYLSIFFLAMYPGLTKRILIQDSNIKKNTKTENLKFLLFVKWTKRRLNSSQWNCSYFLLYHMALSQWEGTPYSFVGKSSFSNIITNFVGKIIVPLYELLPWIHITW